MAEDRTSLGNYEIADNSKNMCLHALFPNFPCFLLTWSVAHQRERARSRVCANTHTRTRSRARAHTHTNTHNADRERVRADSGRHFIILKNPLRNIKRKLSKIHCPEHSFSLFLALSLKKKKGGGSILSSFGLNHRRAFAKFKKKKKRTLMECPNCDLIQREILQRDEVVIYFTALIDSDFKIGFSHWKDTTNYCT